MRPARRRDVQPAQLRSPTAKCVPLQSGTEEHIVQEQNYAGRDVAFRGCLALGPCWPCSSCQLGRGLDLSRVFCGGATTPRAHVELQDLHTAQLKQAFLSCTQARATALSHTQVTQTPGRLATLVCSFTTRHAPVRSMLCCEYAHHLPGSASVSHNPAQVPEPYQPAQKMPLKMATARMQKRPDAAVISKGCGVPEAPPDMRAR